MATIILDHPTLGPIRCLRDPSTSLVKILGLPYGTIPQRFARAKPLDSLENHPRYADNIFDATRPGPTSIQPWGSVTSDASNIPLPTDNLPPDEPQSEDCLNLSLILPPTCLSSSTTLNPTVSLPVLVFLHGGAFFLGSHSRPYYSPSPLLLHALHRSTPFLSLSLNYRLGPLGFLHTPHAADLLPANNGLHDQDLALQWVQAHVAGFGGDPSNVTVLGQSAGGESIATKTMRSPAFRRAIALSGTPVTMPSLTPEEHHENFLARAKALGVDVEDGDGGERPGEEIAREVMSVDVGRIRDLAWVGLPCSSSAELPVRPSMEGLRRGEGREGALAVEAQIIGTATFDGGISYNMLARDASREDHASSFAKIAEEVLGEALARELCGIYGIERGMEDAEGLQRICLFESDVGFFAAALASAEADRVPKTYFQIFDLPNPFEGPVRGVGEFATHTFDVVTLLGGVHEGRLPEGYRAVVGAWRDRILDFVVSGKAPCREFIGDKGEERRGLVVDEEGVREVGEGAWLDGDGGRRRRLFDLAHRVDGEAGCDVLWVDVCRRFLMKGE